MLAKLPKTLSQLRQQVIQAQNGLSEAVVPQEPIPELINSANLLRQNEHLSRTNQKQSNLVAAYEQYSKALEGIISNISAIKTELKILKSKYPKKKLSKKKRTKQKSIKKRPLNRKSKTSHKKKKKSISKKRQNRKTKATTKSKTKRAQRQ